MRDFVVLKMLSQAQLLDELMGRDRNLAPQDKKSSLHWSDPGVSVEFLFNVDAFEEKRGNQIWRGLEQRVSILILHILGLQNVPGRILPSRSFY